MMNDAEQLLPLLYDELRRLAAAKLANERSGHTLDAAALVHEAYLNLMQTQCPPVATGGLSSKSQFLRTAACLRTFEQRSAPADLSFGVIQ